MTDHEIVDRLRAADPARGTGVDLTRLRTAVDARIAAEAGGGGIVPVTDLNRAPSRRGRRLRVAGAAASALVVGAVGFGLGDGLLLGSPGGVGAVPSEKAATSGPVGDAITAPEIANGTAVLDSDTSRTGPPLAGRQVFRAVGLTGEAGNAATWAFDATGAWSAERVAEVAAVLGVEGVPELADGTWVVGAADGSDAYLLVYPDGRAGLNFHDPVADPERCAAVRGAEQCPDPGAPPGGDEARRLTRDLLADLGLDPGDHEYEISAGEGSAGISVAAHQVLGGNRTGVVWWASWTGAGLRSVSGSLATLVELGDYPTIGAEEAVSRITDPRFGAFGGLSLLPAARGGGDDASDAPATRETAPAEPPVPPAAGSSVRWPVEDVAITGAALGTAPWTTPDGVGLLVPAWELSADGGRTWTVLAVAEDALDLAPLE